MNFAENRRFCEHIQQPFHKFCFKWIPPDVCKPQCSIRTVRIREMHLAYLYFIVGVCVMKYVHNKHSYAEQTTAVAPAKSIVDTLIIHPNFQINYDTARSLVPNKTQATQQNAQKDHRVKNLHRFF